MVDSSLITFCFGLTAFFGGLIAVPVGGAFLLLVPVFLLLGLNGLETLLLSRLAVAGAMLSGSTYFFLQHRKELNCRLVGFFLAGNLVGYLLAAKFVTAIDIEVLTTILPWILLVGAIFLVQDFRLNFKVRAGLVKKVLPVAGLAIGFYAGIGGAPSALIIFLFSFLLPWSFPKVIVNTRCAELFGNLLVVGAYLAFGAALTGYEVSVFLAALMGGLLGAKLVFKSKPVWLKKAFLGLVLLTALKNTWEFFQGF